MYNNNKFKTAILIVSVVGVILMLVCTGILMFVYPPVDSNWFWLTVLGLCIGIAFTMLGLIDDSEMEDYEDNYEYIVIVKRK